MRSDKQSHADGIAIYDQDAYDQHDLKEFRVDATIPLKYHGTAADQRDMVVLGKTQVLRRNFKFVTMLGFASTVMASWEVLLPLFGLVLVDGGTPDLFWGFIVEACGMLLVYASLAELASMSPTAGGQYHWVSEFGPPKVQKLLSYLVGWLCAIGWQVYLAGVCFMVGGIIQGLIALNYPSYVPQRWHATLLTIAIIASAIMFNTFLAVRLPLIEGIVLVLHLCGIFAIIIPLWVMAPRAPAHTALLDFVNNGGWPTTGLSSMIGLVTPLNVLIGYDCSVHMSEEIEDASLTLPKAIIWSVAPNAVLGLLMIVTLAFTAGDVPSILHSATGQPFIQMFFNATQSHAGTTVMAAIIVVLLCSCCFSEVATASRQLWSFSRDRGFPGSDWLSVVQQGWNIPLRAVLVSFVVVSLLACINIGSTTALRSISSLGGVAILSSYIVTIGCLIWRRTYGAPLPPRRWSLGKAGLWINIAAFLFVLPLWFFTFWPLATPVLASTMNWSSVIFFGVLLIAMVYYVFKARHEYTGPVALIKREN
ncbi:hypothetical protein LTR54_017732 [Friedmanniomyces endolithicus]|nr:hypothetical protein LTR54_017732 [Friedmanniomyces endolithicus]